MAEEVATRAVYTSEGETLDGLYSKALDAYLCPFCSGYWMVDNEGGEEECVGCGAIFSEEVAE